MVALEVEAEGSEVAVLLAADLAAEEVLEEDIAGVIAEAMALEVGRLEGPEQLVPYLVLEGLILIDITDLIIDTIAIDRGIEGFGIRLTGADIGIVLGIIHLLMWAGA